MRILSLLFTLMLWSIAVVAQNTSEWHEPFPPHRIADNLYYVGSRGLASYLITTPDGHILVNACFERTVPMIRANVEQLGFKITDIKIILSSHAHDDHVEGQGLLRELTGASVFAMEGDADVIRKGGEGQYLYTNHWRPCSIDRVLKDGDRVTLGGATLTAHSTPGHTRGCTTWTMTAFDHDKPQQVVIIGSPNVNPGYQLAKNRDYPKIADDYKRTFQILKSLPCDLFLGAHGSYYDMESKYAKLKAGAATNPFIDREGYRAYVEEREKAFLETLKSQER